MTTLTFVEGIKLLLKNKGLRYPFVSTVIFIIFYYSVLLSLGLPSSTPVYLGELNIYVFSFLLLVTFSVYLLLITLLMAITVSRTKLLAGKTDLKLLFLNVLSFVSAMFIPPSVFLVIYFVPFVFWSIFSSLFMVMLLWETSERINNVVKKRSEKLKLGLFALFLIIDLGLFGMLYGSLENLSVMFESTMILLFFPLFIVLLPIFAVATMLRGKDLKQVTLFGFLVFTVVSYYFAKVNSLIPFGKTGEIDLVNVVVQVFLVVYGLGSLAYRGEKISTALRLPFEVVLVPLLWFKVSSLIVLIAVSEILIMGYSPIVGEQLSTMFSLIVVGTIYGIYQLIKK